MAKMIDSLSVFFPAYNEEAHVELTVRKTKKVLEEVASKWEIIIVNDGSNDKTKEIAQTLSKEDKKIRVINHSKNGGYGEALKSGFYNSKYEWVAYIDIDGQFDFTEISKFLGKKDSADLLMGYRMKRQDSFYRLLFAKGWALALFVFFGLRLKDVDCGFKMVSKKVLDTIPHLESTRGGMINAELPIKTKKYGFKIAEIGVHHFPRTAGHPKGADLNVIIKSFIDLFKLWIKLR
jgi:glycosyltransferase involved in cell wall biosynthesis